MPNLRSILTPRRGAAAIAVAAVLVAGACGDDPTSASGDGGRPMIVATTSIVGDIVEHVAGDEADVEVLLPRGADPHEASLSAREADAMTQADLVVTNGAGFEQGMADVLDAVEDDGTSRFALADHVELLAFAETHGDEAHAGEDEHAEEDGEHGHEEGDDDPHVWTDPSRIAGAVEALGERVAELDGLDPTAVERRTAGYVAELDDLDADIEGLLADVPEDRRVLVTNHEVFGYFADRYGFEVVGAVIPSGTTQAEPSQSQVEELAETIEREGVTAIFAESTQSRTLAETLADSVGGEGDVEVVTLFTESLGEVGTGAETYVDMMHANAELIAEALA